MTEQAEYYMKVEGEDLVRRASIASRNREQEQMKEREKKNHEEYQRRVNWLANALQRPASVIEELSPFDGSKNVVLLLPHPHLARISVKWASGGRSISGGLVGTFHQPASLRQRLQRYTLFGKWPERWDERDVRYFHDLAGLGNLIRWP